MDRPFVIPDTEPESLFDELFWSALFIELEP
jgi:hypothetical protein